MFCVVLVCVVVIFVVLGWLKYKLEDDKYFL